ncbi:aspartate-semialdehyde dehydrogenase [Treponema phagedenis]|uniref:Aspartate-semialdehyde dehydrogenase n=1 Tax=Treponema phagedenis TaxID=162 RepID=A0A0B7GWT1_TREPH|nr:aspartate-semialdehyde dehydrogenase [Treponema phagedenis]QSH99002.1 aspartate-semialdehyde dehydrogenase [Treponema phagedenis]CEM63144.1 Aspartate-semialdehyde dehydrogenase [Treponema phagedenis]
MKKIVIAGATGLVGSTICSILEERNFPIADIRFLASEKSAGKEITFRGKKHRIEVLDENAFDGFDIAFFAVSSDLSRRFVPIAANKGLRVIDNSSCFRMDKNVPLVVPEVNPQAITKDNYIIANPNCSTIQCMAPLFQIQQHYGLKRIVYSTYQSVSGSGMKGLRDLDENIQEFYPYPITKNIIPHIDSFLENGYTKEEIKMIMETKKILHQDSLKITATTVRVPIRFSHSVSVNVETTKDFDIAEVKSLMDNKLGMILVDNPMQNRYPVSSMAEGNDAIYVGRIRRDESLEFGLNLWTVADNIRKGAALNAVQIGEYLNKAGL